MLPYSIAEPPTLTQPPRTMNVESTSVELAWDAWDSAVDTGTGPVTGYLIYYREDGASSWQMAGNVTARTLTFTVTSLASVTTYEFVLSAVRPGPNGGGALSPTVIAKTNCLGKIVRCLYAKTTSTFFTDGHMLTQNEMPFNIPSQTQTLIQIQTCRHSQRIHVRSCFKLMKLINKTLYEHKRFVKSECNAKRIY